MKNYTDLLRKIDGFALSVQKKHPAAFECGPGCAECCVPGISVWRVEFDGIVSHLTKHPGAEPSSGRTKGCPFLDASLRCTIYAVRPVVCRLWGLPQLSENSLTCCEKNFRSGCRLDELPASDIVDMETVLKTLAAINHVYCTSRGLDPEARLLISEACAQKPGRT